MASNLCYAREQRPAPLFIRDGDPIPDGVDPERVTFVARTYVDPPERVEDELPASQELSRDESNSRQRRDERLPLEYPRLGIA